MTLIEISSILEVLPVVLEIEKETLLFVIVYCMHGLLGPFAEHFILLISELPTKHRILIVGDFSLHQILLENVVKVDTLIQILTCLCIHNIQLICMEGCGILYLILQLQCCFFSAITLQWSLCSFFLSLIIIFIKNVAFNTLALNLHYITYK